MSFDPASYQQLLEDKPLICYALLCGSGNTRAEHIPFIQDLTRISVDFSHPFRYRVILVQGASSPCVAHNIAVKAFLNDPSFSWLWIWADDMIPNETAVHQLKAAHSGSYDIIAPAVRVWNSQLVAPYLVSGHLNTIREDGGIVFDFPDFFPSGEPFEPDASGTGGLLIHRRVLADPRMSIGKDTDKGSAIFRDLRDDSGDRILGHDLDFTWRAKKLGYRLLCVPGTLYGHIHKGIDINEICVYADSVTRSTLEAKEVPPCAGA